MTYDEMIDWFTNDDWRGKTGGKDQTYADIIRRPFTNEESVINSIKEMKHQAKLNQDKKTETFVTNLLKYVGTERVLTKLTPEIDKENKRWEEELRAEIDEANNDIDLDFVIDKIKTDRGSDKSNYRDETEKAIKKAVEEKRRQFVGPEAGLDLTPRQKDNILNILGLPEEVFDQIGGVREIQRQLEFSLRDRIEGAETLEELNEVERDLNTMPTKIGISRLRKEIKQKKKELRGG